MRAIVFVFELVFVHAIVFVFVFVLVFVLAIVFVFVQGVFFHRYPPKKFQVQKCESRLG